MGQIVKKDLGISIEVELALLSQIKKDIRMAIGWERDLLIMSGAYASVCYCGSFRGHEVFLMDLEGLFRYMQEAEMSNKQNYVMIPLL